MMDILYGATHQQLEETTSPEDGTEGDSEEEVDEDSESFML